MMFLRTTTTLVLVVEWNDALPLVSIVIFNLIINLYHLTMGFLYFYLIIWHITLERTVLL
jgi:hypothetical protein